MLLLPMLRLVYLDALVTMCWYSLNMFEGLRKLSTIMVVPTDMNQKIVFVCQTVVVSHMRQSVMGRRWSKLPTIRPSRTRLERPVWRHGSEYSPSTIRDPLRERGEGFRTERDRILH